MSIYAKDFDVGDIKPFSTRLNTSDLGKKIRASLDVLHEGRNLNAFISVCSSRQLQDYLKQVDTSLPLTGVTFSVKDNILTKAFPTTVGSTIFKDFKPAYNAVIVDQLEKAGAF